LVITLLTQEIISTLAHYCDGMTKVVSIVLNAGAHEKRGELTQLLRDVADISSKIKFYEKDFGHDARSPITFTLEVDSAPTGIYFSGIPGGHEFNSFILAILQSGGVDLKLEKHLQNIISNISEKLSFEIFISLGCQNCPDVVQACNQFALLNENISSEMIDGGLFREEVEGRKIQGVPSVYLNGELFASGRVDISTLIEKLGSFTANNDNKTQATMPLQDVVVIGGGPAGISAAIYASRKGFKVSVISKNIGGQLKETLGIENFISVSKTTGTDLAKAMQNHMADYEITLKEHVSVKKINTGPIKEIVLSTGEKIKSRTIIYATGANWKQLGVPGEQENIGSGVAYCPHCDGPFYKGKDVAVIGGGNSGVEAALDLSGIVRTVLLFEFLPELKADQVLIEQILGRKNIFVFTNAETKRILSSNGKVTGLEYEERTTRESIEKSVEGVFIQVGLQPNSGLIAGHVRLNKYGEVIIDEYCNTSAEGVFACGDVTTIPYKQIIMSMGEGSKAAITAADYLQKHPINVDFTDEQLAVG